MDAFFSKGQAFFNMEGDYGKLCPVWALGFALSAAVAARASNKNANFLYGTALTALNQLGGWMVVCLMLGKSSVLFDKEDYIIFSALAWLATGRAEVTDMLGSAPAKIWLHFANTIMNCKIMNECMDAGAGAGGAASNYYSHAFVVSLACGLVGGLGSAFVPFNNGIGSMNDWVLDKDDYFNLDGDWGPRSALLFCGWRCALRDPNVGKIAGALFGANNNHGFHAASATAFFTLAPLLHGFFPGLPNPLNVEALELAGGGGGGGGGKKRSSSPKRK